jgi:tetratricopeptide (TPR) repeat protein
VQVSFFNFSKIKLKTKNLHFTPSRKTADLIQFKSVKAIIIFTLANCLEKLLNPQDATAYYIDLINSDQISVPFATLYANLSKIIDEEKDLVKKRYNLIAVYKCLKRRVINSNWVDLECMIKLAGMSGDLKEFEFSVICYEKILLLNPKDISAMFNLSLVHIQLNDYENVGKTYLRIANFLKEEIKPNEIYLEDDENSNINKCIRYYFEAQKLLPNNIDVFIGLSEIHRMIDRHKEALGYIDHALKIDDKDFKIYYEGFLAYEEIGDYHTAKEMIRICLILNIKFVKGFNAFGNLMRKEKNYELALELFETALMREPENVLVLNNYGTCYLETGNKSKAKEIYLQAYHLDNNLFEINCNLSNIYRRECKKNILKFTFYLR